MSRELTVVLVLAAVALSAGCACVFMRISRRNAAVEAVKVLHRAEKAGWRDQLAAKDTEIARLNAALVAKEKADTHRIITGDVVTRAAYNAVVAELATLRRAWESGISFVADGDRPVVEHRHEEVA